MDVRGNSVSIADGDATPSTGDYTDFGSTVVGTTVTRTFYVYNTGTGPLVPGSITVPSGFTLTVGLNPSIPAGSSDYFTVRLNAASAGTHAGDISIPNNDANENPYNFRITGNVTAPPGTPSTPSPANGATVSSQPTILDWADTSGATSYDVYLDGTFRANVSISQWTVNQTLTLSSHNWYVVAKNSAGSTTGPTWNFTISCPTPGFPSSPYPANGATVSSQPTILDWSDANGATSYDVYLDGTFRANVSASQWTLNQTLTLSTHSWYVIAKNSCGQSTGPPVLWSFTINCPVPGTPSTPNPVNGSTVNSQPTILDWADTSGATSYDVYLDGTFRANVSVSQWTLNQTLATSSHNWYIVAKNGCGSTTGPTWSFTITPLVQYGNISARLKNVNSTDAPVSSGTPRFKLYTSPNQILSGANPATFSNIPVGTYLLEGYQTGTFWGEEFWNSEQFTVVAGATLNAVLTRKYPYATSVVMKNVETGATITAGQTIAAGTQVRFEVTVRNDVPNTSLNTRVHFVADLGQNAPYDYDWGTSSAQTISGNGGQTTFSFTTAFDAHQTGQFYYSLEVFTDIGGNPVRTDSWNWTQACGIGRISTISGLVDPPGFPFLAPTFTFIQLYPAGTTARIDPNLRTWVVIHGRTGSSTDAWVTDLAGVIKTTYPNDQVLLLDWRDAADAPDISSDEENWIQPVASWAADKLVNYGFAGADINLIGHSWGGNMTDELAERILGGVNTIVALDPAENGTGYYNPEDSGEIEFRAHSQFSWAFHSSLLGSAITPTTADESFIVDTGLNLLYLPGQPNAHGAVHDIYTYMLAHPGGGVSAKFQLIRLLAHQSGPWMPNLFTTSFQQGAAFEFATSGYEGRIGAVLGGQSPNFLEYYDSLSQGKVVYETVDTIAPTVSISSPASGTTYTTAQSVVIMASASDNIGVTKVDFYDGTTFVTSNPMAPYAHGWAITSANNGTHNWTARAYDAAGYVTTSAVVSLTVNIPLADTTPPALTINSPANNAIVTSTSLMVTGTASDSGRGNNGISSVTVNGVSASGGTASGANTASWNSTITLDLGANTITVVAKDSLNNQTLQQITVTYNPPDTQAPTLTITSPANNATVTSPNLPVSGTATDSGRGNNGVSSVTVNGVPASGGTATGAITANWNATIALSPGANTITVVAKDSFNNQTSQQITVTYNPPDTQAPTLTITSPANNTTVTSPSLVVSGTASDSGRGNNGISSVTVNGVNASGGTASGANTANWSATITLNLGVNTITAAAKDTFNNSGQQQISVTYNPPDTTAPAVAITFPTNNATVTSPSLTVTGTASDSGRGNNGVSSVTINGVSASGGTASGANTANWSATITLNPGVNTIAAVAKDAFNNSGQQQITVTYNPPTCLATLLSPASGSVVSGVPTFTWSFTGNCSNKIYITTNPAPELIVVLSNAFSSGMNTLTVSESKWNTVLSRFGGPQPQYYWTVGDADIQQADPPLYAAWQPFTVNQSSNGCSYTVAASAGANGSINPAGSSNVNCGGTATFTATPIPYYAVGRWIVDGQIVQTGGTTYTLPSVQSNHEVRVTFETTQGNYTGLFYESGVVRHESSGYVQLKTTASGSFSGQLLAGGARYSISGQLDTAGHVILNIPQSTLVVELQLDLTNGTDQVTGQVGNGAWTAALLGNRSGFNAATNPCPLMGKYTLVISGSANGAIGPSGNGFGTVTVDGAGLVSLKGVLADGTKIAQKKVPLSKNGDWAFYSSLYSGKGWILSWITFTNRPTDSLNGEGSWIKTSGAITPMYPGGFTNKPAIRGSTYNPPLSGRVINFTNGAVVLGGGNLTQSWMNRVTLGADNKVVNAGSNTLAFTISLKTGLFKGSFVEPGTGRKVSFTGALLQKQNSGAGYFLGSNEAGLIIFESLLDRPVIESPTRAPGGFFSFSLAGVPGQIYTIETSPNLATWTPLATLTNATGSVQFTDSNMPPSRARFYRARLLP